MPFVHGLRWALVAFLLGAAEAQAVTLAVVGDSLSEGYGVESTSAWPVLLEAGLRARKVDVSVLNAGVSGATSAAAVARIRWLNRRKVDVVILALGANDGLRGLSAASMKSNLTQAVTLARQQGCRVILAGMKVTPNMGAEYGRAFEAVFPALATECRLEYVPFLLEGVAADPALNQSDRIHPNEEGHRRIAEHWLAYFEKHPL